MMQNKHRSSERGATALFIVIFSILLMSTITLSFLSLMVREQQRSTNDELSQSAYDSALAGVEDAKRAIVAARGSGIAAQAAQNAIDASQQANGCQEVGRYVNGISTNVEEIKIQSSTSSAGAELNQAYTCLKVNALSNDYQTYAEDNQVVLVPLKMREGINELTIYWQRASEIASGSPLSFPGGATTPLMTSNQWLAQNYPAMLRLQTVTPASSFRLSDFNDAETSSAAFLYPATVGATVSSGVDMPERAGAMTAPNRPVAVACDDSPSAIRLDSYLCSLTIDLARTVPAGSEASYLVLRPIYRPTSIKIEGRMNGRIVQFDGVQPIVDSTGRSNDLFRRVQARLTLGGEGERGSGLGGVIPQYALDVDGSICKNFYVARGISGGYQPQCNP